MEHIVDHIYEDAVKQSLIEDGGKVAKDGTKDCCHEIVPDNVSLAANVSRPLANTSNLSQYMKLDALTNVGNVQTQMRNEYPVGGQSSSLGKTYVPITQPQHQNRYAL